LLSVITSNILRHIKKVFVEGIKVLLHTVYGYGHKAFKHFPYLRFVTGTVTANID